MQEDWFEKGTKVGEKTQMIGHYAFAIGSPPVEEIGAA
jgi:hypothetical protein